MIKFECTILYGVNKVGNLKPDADGYYEVVLGGFETSNVHGHYYNYTETTKRIFEESSTFMRNIKGGHLYGEWGHPTRKPNESIMMFLKRCILVSEDRMAFHIRNVRLDEDSVKDKDGRTIVAVIGEIKPAGPYGNHLREILDNKSANCCFSVRAMTDDTAGSGGKEIRAVKEVITWDFVIDPGVQTSTKYHSPKLESVSSVDLDYELLIQTREEFRREMNTLGLGFESSSASAILDNVINNVLARADSTKYRTMNSRNW